jgi:hypothetical protein
MMGRRLRTSKERTKAYRQRLTVANHGVAIHATTEISSCSYRNFKSSSSFFFNSKSGFKSSYHNSYRNSTESFYKLLGLFRHDLPAGQAIQAAIPVDIAHTEHGLATFNGRAGMLWGK